MYYPRCNKNVEVVEIYLTKTTITYKCIECGCSFTVGR